MEHTPFATEESLTTEERKAIRGSGTIYHVLVFPIAAFGMWMIYHPWPLEHWSCRALWVLLTSYSFFSLTSCLHETVHQTFCSSRRVNVWLGRVIGTMLLLPYTVYRESHIRHHGHLNRPTDWELWPYSDPKSPRVFRHLFVWFDLFFGFLATPLIYGRIFFHWRTPVKFGSKIWRVMLYEYMAVAAVWGTFLGALDYHGVLGTKHALWALPLLTMTFIQTGRKLTEHLGMDSFDPLRGTRTVIGKSVFTRFCSYLQFDIFVHGPHHRHPRVPHTQLEAKMQDCVAKNPDVSYPVFSHYWQAVWDMLPHLFINPGCGVNAGGYLPRVIHPDVTSFASDVAEPSTRDERSSEARAKAA